jgi:hypothetical protein
MIKKLYNLIRPWLPRDYAKFNGVRSKGVRYFDRTRNFPDYEAELCSVITQHLRSGMAVVEVGGGLGISAVYASKLIGEDGSLTVYEGSEQHTEIVRDTINCNETPSKTVVQNQIVGQPIHLYEESNTANSIPPAKLPDCDALVLDCEGTEIQILSEYTHTPQVVVVETHEQFVPGCTTGVECILNHNNYEVVTRERQSENIVILGAIQS